MASEWFYGGSARQLEQTFNRSFATSRSLSSYSQTTGIVKLIIGTNILVFGAWIYGEQTRNTALLRQLTDKFTLSLRNLKESRYYTLLTCAFSHRDVAHIAFNMFNIWTFGQILGWAGVGPANTTLLCLGSAIAGSAAWAYHHAFIKPDPRQKHVIMNSHVMRAKDMDTAIGASGMVMGAGAVAACLAPFAPMQLMFIPINIPLWGIVAGYFAIDSYFLNTGKMIGHAAHMGGAVAGVAYYFLMLRGFGGVSRMIGRAFR